MGNAIDALAAKYNETPFIYSLCQWGWENPYNWAPRISQAWRIDNDIKPWWWVSLFMRSIVVQDVILIQ